jgi:predicted nucleotidyltransferase
VPPIDIKPSDLDIVTTILRRQVPDREVLVFGSRVTGKAKPFSDLDLAVMGDQPLSSTVLGQLHDEFDESTLPFKVDIVDWATTNPAFKQIIARDGVRIDTA